MPYAEEHVTPKPNAPPSVPRNTYIQCTILSAT
jgi:hypothetical protein